MPLGGSTGWLAKSGDQGPRLFFESGETVGGEVNWAEPTGRVIVNPDGSINLLVALHPAGAEELVQVTLPSAASGKQAAPVSELMTVALDRFILENAAFEFVDRSIKPNVQLSPK